MVFEYPDLVSLESILDKLGLDSVGLSDDLLSLRFFDYFNSFEYDDNGSLVLIGDSVGGDVDRIVLDFVVGGLVYFDMSGGVVRRRVFDKWGFDWSSLFLL
jgi:hypothetical protein